LTFTFAMIQVMDTEVVLSLGGNRGEREGLLNQAVERLKANFEVVKISSIYETAAWGGVAKGDFLNQVAVVHTAKSPEEVLSIIQDIETKLGRKREEPWGDRTMDIDILYFGNAIVDTDQLKIPHPFIAKRKFVLVPLAEILPDKLHPIYGKSSREMLEVCDDGSDLRLFR
jgi:2-amino-4-hydroxy-6-hydroxymethyldihydropteridine diphosphokinase